MIKVGCVWLNVERVHFALIDGDEKLRVKFGEGSTATFDKMHSPKEFSMVLRALDEAAGVKPKTALQQDHVPPMPEVKPHKRTNYEMLKEADQVELLDLLEALGFSPPDCDMRACPGSGSCRACWRNWLESEEVTEDVH